MSTHRSLVPLMSVLIPMSMNLLDLVPLTSLFLTPWCQFAIGLLFFRKDASRRDRRFNGLLSCLTFRSLVIFPSSQSRLIVSRLLSWKICCSRRFIYAVCQSVQLLITVVFHYAWSRRGYIRLYPTTLKVTPLLHWDPPPHPFIGQSMTFGILGVLLNL